MHYVNKYVLVDRSTHTDESVTYAAPPMLCRPCVASLVQTTPTIAPPLMTMPMTYAVPRAMLWPSTASAMQAIPAAAPRMRPTIRLIAKPKLIILPRSK